MNPHLFDPGRRQASRAGRFVIATLASIAVSGIASASAEAVCDADESCYYNQQGYMGQGSEYPLSGGGAASAWLPIGFGTSSLHDARSAKNRYGARRILLAEGTTSNPSNILCIPRTTWNGAFSARSIFRIGAQGSGNDC